MHSSSLGFRAKFASVPMVLLLLALWLALHGFHGLAGDGRIYAFQAFARLHPQLATDLYLQNTSQDQFTVFSPLYAWCIRLCGMDNAARLLTLVFTLWFSWGVWTFARAVTDRDTAWASVAFLFVIAGYYGSSNVFRILEPFLTARLPAEALTVTGLACHALGRKRIGLSLASAALLLHPLMALPGLLLIICLWLPLRASLVGAIGGLLATFAVAVAAVELPLLARAVPVMDAPWLDVVRERSQFLFLQLWSVRDWDANAQPFLYLGFTAIAVTEQRIRKLCAAAALVGAAGLAVSLIGGLVGPVAILVQGQAWRWMWITVLVSAVLVPFTASQVWRDDKCGPLCALLLISGWTVPGIDGIASVGLALLLWLVRAHLSSLAAANFRSLSAAAFGVAVLAWTLFKCWPIVSASTPPSNHVLMNVVRLQDVFALKVPAALLAAAVWWGVTFNRRAWLSALLSVVLAGFSALFFPAAFKQARALASNQEFSDWADVIPLASAVLVAPPHDGGELVWFTLARPAYLTADQSAGVVFSRTTALEVRRRSEILRPLMDPNWKILTNLRARSGTEHQMAGGTHPLTAKKLMGVCADPQLGFVISPERVGFDPLPHDHAGAWKGWNLYDCRKVRSAPSTS